MKICPLCKSDLTEFETYLLHPVNHCKIKDGLELSVINEETQNILRKIAEELPVEIAEPKKSLFSKLKYFIKP